MSDYPDQPDYQQAVVPSVTRWAPGTEFGAVSWTGTMTHNTFQDVIYPIPNEGFTYVIDKVFVYTEVVGLLIGTMFVCNNYGTPDWIAIATALAETAFEFNPFHFESMALSYPNAIKWAIENSNNINRYGAVYCTMYRYLTNY